jgi:hypothetical protein
MVGMKCEVGDECTIYALEDGNALVYERLESHVVELGVYSGREEGTEKGVGSGCRDWPTQIDMVQ